MRIRVALPGIVLLTFLCTSAACSKHWCKNTYDLLSREDCGRSEGPARALTPSPSPCPKCPSCPAQPQPAPGPIIIAKKSLGGGSGLIWQAQVGSGSPVTQTPSGSIFPDCKLRDDLIGIQILDFEVTTVNGFIPSATKVVLDNNAKHLEIKRTSVGSVLWSYKDKMTGQYCLALIPSGTSGTGTIPLEFDGFNIGDFAAQNGDPGREMDLQVQVP